MKRVTTKAASVFRLAFALAVLAECLACSSATYLVQSPTPDPSTKKPTVYQTVEAKAPGGDAYVTVVYFGKDKQPVVNANGDSTELVNATAAAGRSAINAALKKKP